QKKSRTPTTSAPRPTDGTGPVAPPAPPDRRTGPEADEAFVDDTEAGASHLAPAHPPSSAPTVAGLSGGARPIGRIPVLDVRPLVDDGDRPAKSVVGEEF